MCVFIWYTCHLSHPHCNHASNLPVNKMFVLDLQVCYWVIGSNLILRCTWTYKLSAHLRHNYLTVFTITALEIFRHFQWIFFRVEDEWNKMTTLRPSLELAMDDNPKEDNRLLGSSNHGVNKLMLPIPAPAIPFSFHWILMALQHFV